MIFPEGLETEEEFATVARHRTTFFMASALGVLFAGPRVRFTTHVLKPGNRCAMFLLLFSEPGRGAVFV